MPFNAFNSMAFALWVLALCALVTVLKQFGFWRWAADNLTAPYQWFLTWLARIRA